MQPTKTFIYQGKQLQLFLLVFIQITHIHVTFVQTHQQTKLSSAHGMMMKGRG